MSSIGPLPSPRGLEVAGVSERERQIIHQAFSNPLEIPPLFKGWLEGYFTTLFDKLGAAGSIVIPSTGVDTSLPASPTDLQEFVLVDSLTAPTYAWRFKYFAGISDANKWVYVGGSPALVEVPNSDATNTTDSYQALANAGPSFTPPRAGNYLVAVGCRASAASGRGAARMSYDIGATGAVDADAAWNTQGDFALSNSAGHERTKAGLTVAALVAKYRPGAAVAATFSDRWMRVTPLRVS